MPPPPPPVTPRALVLGPAGSPPVSPITSSILRPAIVELRALRNRLAPCSIWMPPCASGPVLTVRSPILTGLFWAIAGIGRFALKPSPAAAFGHVRLGDLLFVLAFLPDRLLVFH